MHTYRYLDFRGKYCSIPKYYFKIVIYVDK
jgi:hypothetical protein